MSMTKRPYEPDMKHCRMIIRTSDATCYVMDTCCREVSIEQQRKVDQKIAYIYRQAVMRRNIREGGQEN